MIKIGESELILNKDGSIFHLHLLPEHIADTIILVGDQDRVNMISKYFDKIEFKVQNREFRTHTGYYNRKRLTALSTGIGTDNIDIVINELDAICNIDLEQRVVKKEHKSLNLIRIGTSGALQEDIPVDTPVISEMAIGFDGLLNFYQDRDKICNLEMEKDFTERVNWNSKLAKPYFIGASENLLYKVGKTDMRRGLTISAPGFYAPQGRFLRLPVVDPDLNSKITDFSYNNKKITNFEMESSAIYGLSKLLGHNAVTVCNIIANRVRKEYSADYKISMKNLIVKILDRLTD